MPIKFKSWNLFGYGVNAMVTCVKAEIYCCVYLCKCWWTQMLKFVLLWCKWHGYLCKCWNLLLWLWFKCQSKLYGNLGLSYVCYLFSYGGFCLLGCFGYMTSKIHPFSNSNIRRSSLGNSKSINFLINFKKSNMLLVIHHQVNTLAII